MLRTPSGLRRPLVPVASLGFAVACSFSTLGLGEGMSTEAAETTSAGGTADAGTTTVEATTTTSNGTTSTDGTTLAGSSGSTEEATGPQMATGPQTTTGTTAGDEASETAVEGECDEAEGVVGNPKCIDGTLPYCKVDTCVSCEGVDCESLDPDRPTCEPNSGVCVQCLVDSDCTGAGAPHCDPATALCGPCTEHGQCTGTACNLESGECFPPENVLYVRNSPGCDDAGPGTAANAPLCTLQTALGSKVDPGVPTTVKVRSGASLQTLPAGLKDGDYIVAIVPFDVQGASLVVPASGPALDVAPGNTVFVAQFNIYNSGVPLNDPAIQCNGAKLWLDGIKVFNTKTPMRAGDCEVHLRRVAMTSNAGGGVDIDGPMASLRLENSYVTNNGGAFGGVRFMNGAAGEILYSTIALNTAAAPAVACLNADDVTVRNSVLVVPIGNMELSCPNGADITNVMANADTQGDASELFSSFTGGEFRANPDGPLKDAAIWRAGDPRGDYDSHGVRPTREGPDFAGADVP